MLERLKNCFRALTNKTAISTDEKLKLRKSNVRVHVTLMASFYVFVGGPVVCAVYILAPFLSESTDLNLNEDLLSTVKELYLTVLPIASGILAYWFANRATLKSPEPVSDAAAKTQEQSKGVNKDGQPSP